MIDVAVDVGHRVNKNFKGPEGTSSSVCSTFAVGGISPDIIKSIGCKVRHMTFKCSRSGSIRCVWVCNFRGGGHIPANAPVGNGCTAIGSDRATAYRSGLADGRDRGCGQNRDSWISVRRILTIF